MKLDILLGRVVVVGLLSITFIISSCTDKATTIGSELDNSSEGFEIGMTDTITVEAYSVLLDTMRTDLLSTNLIGSINDPIFGELTSSVATQLLTSVDTPDFGSNPVVDSVIFTLTYNGYYGDTMDFQTFNIYELDEILDFPEKYYTKDVITHKPTLLATKTFQPRPGVGFITSTTNLTDSIIYDTISPRLRFDLNLLGSEFADKIIYAPEEHMSSSSNFVEYMKGFYITAEKAESGGSISYFDLGSASSMLQIIYSNDSADNKVYSLLMNDFSERFTSVNHNNYEDASTEFIEQVIDGNKDLGKNQLYLQGLSGVETIIKFPHIKKLSLEGQIIVNRAELILKTDNIKQEGFAAPVSLNLFKITEDGEIEFLLDQIEGEDSFGGTYDEDQKEYRFRISKYIQNLISDNSSVDYGLRLSISGSNSKADRVIFYGTNPDNPALFGDRMRLELVYSIVND